MRGIYQNIELK